MCVWVEVGSVCESKQCVWMEVGSVCEREQCEWVHGMWVIVSGHVPLLMT